MNARALWVLPLGGYCAVCELPATRMSVYADYRVIVHANGGSCTIHNPKPPANPDGYAHRP